MELLAHHSSHVRKACRSKVCQASLHTHWTTEGGSSLQRQQRALMQHTGSIKQAQNRLAVCSSAHLSPHGFDHLPAQLHGWWEGLGVVAKDVAKVNVEQTAIRHKHQVVQVPAPAGESNFDKTHVFACKTSPNQVSNRTKTHLGCGRSSCRLRRAWHGCNHDVCEQHDRNFHDAPNSRQLNCSLWCRTHLSPTPRMYVMTQ